MTLLSDHTTSYSYGPDYPLALTVQYAGPGLWGRQYPTHGTTNLNFALYPHEGDWEQAGVPQQSEAWNTPPTPSAFYHKVAFRDRSFLQADDRRLALSAAWCSDGAFHFRLYNASREPVSSHLHIGMPATGLTEEDLQGQPGQHLLVQVAPGFGQLHAQLRQHVAPVDHAGKVHGLGQRVHPAVILEGHQAAGVKILCHVLKPGKLAQIAHGFAEGELVGQVVLHGQRHVRRGAAGDGEHDGVDRACGQLARGQHMQVDDDAGLGGEFLIGQLFQDFAPLRAAGDPHVQHGGFLVLCAAVVHDQAHAVVVLGKGCQEVFSRHRHALEEIGGGDVHRHVGGGQHQVVHRHGAFFDGGNVGAQVALRVVQIAEGFGNPVHVLGEEVKLVDDLPEVVLHGGGFVGDGGQQIGAFLKPPGQVAQLSAQLRHGAVQIVFVVIVRFGAGDFHNFTLHPAQVGGVLFGTAHDFADGPQLHRGGQGVRALFQVEAIGGSVRVAEGVAIPMAVVGEGIQLHFLEGDLPVDHDLTIGGHTGVGGLQYFQVNGVQAAFRHVNVPAHRRVAQPPAVAAHDVQHPVRAGLGFGQGVGVGFAADDVFAAPGAVLGL